MRARTTWTRRGVLLGALGAGATAALHATGSGRATAAALPPLLVGDQKSRRVLLLDSATTTWEPSGDPASVRWEFTPEEDSRYDDLDPGHSWTYVSEVKSRTWQGKTYLLTTASYGFAAVVEHPGKNRYWAARVTDAAGTEKSNPHSIELLPDGNVAVALSGSGEVRLYAASRSPYATEYTSVPLTSAHGVHWDPATEMLWAVGSGQLAAYELNGPATGRTLVRAYATDLPGPVPGRAPGGHDLNAVAGEPDLFWVSTTDGLLQYSKSRRQFAPYVPSSCGGTLANVKAVSNAGATVALTAPDGGLDRTWWTRSVRVDNGPVPAHTLAGAAYGGIYKARWWQP
ncbi:DUF6528 family protein [Streptomyces sp. M92]|uniref:DUF6528 family protein n=1 Tax=Streptomyces sp. M92 TaxID=2944250 RepID=UPI0023498FB1|nr:DUF6528 family protein [Streptomyces sp. M92]WCN01182.1 DUF6528 family protein [Streptomyces sp. M92]